MKKKKKSKPSSKNKARFLNNFFSVAPGEVNWTYCAAGVVLGYFGCKQLVGDFPRWFSGLSLQAIAAWLIWSAFPGKFHLLPEPKTPAPARKSRLQPPPSLFYLIPLLIPAALGQYFFFSEKLTQGLIAWAVSLSLACFLKFKAPEGVSPSSQRLENVGLVLVLAAASLMRFPFVAQHVVGLQIDEANNILDSYSVMDGSFRSPYVFGWGGNESLPFFIYALFFKVFGKNFMVARAFSAVVSIAGLYFFYRWCRLFFSTRASLAATFFLSVSWWYLFYSLSPFHNMLVVFFEILSFYFLERCLRHGAKADFALLGVLAALGFLGYLPGRLIPVMLALVVLVFAASDIERFLKSYWKPFLLPAFLFLLIVGPFLMNILIDSSNFLSRSKELSLFNEVHRTGHYDLIFTRSFWTLMSFAYPAESYDERFALHHNPEMDPLTGLLLFFGLLLALLSPTKRWSWQALIGFTLAAVANAFAIQGPNPEPIYVNCMRFFLITPFLFFMGARTIDWLSSLFSGPSRRSQILFTSILVAAMVFSAFWNGRVFYSQFHHSRSGWAYLGFNHIRVADAMKANYPRCHILLDSEYDSSTVQVLTHAQINYLPVKTLQLPLNFKVEKNVFILFQGNDFDENQMRQTYPNAAWGTVTDEWGGVVVKTVEISKADIEALQDGKQPAATLP